MLLDCLSKYHSFDCKNDVVIDSILLYAPQTARSDFEELLRYQSLQSAWRLVPQISELTVDLGAKLKSALETERSRGASFVGFIAMDCPELTKQDILSGVNSVLSIPRLVYLKPSVDGGYVFICLPSDIPSAVFDDVCWSSATTLQSQIQAIHRVGYQAKVSDSLSYDVDEWQDVEDLYKRLMSNNCNPEEVCLQTWNALRQLQNDEFRS